MIRSMMPRPVVSIGIPVYNAERFLKQALTSLLGQTFCDLEIIISDNASTDSTPVICEDFARQDSRVRCIFQPRNIGAPRNWNAVVHAAHGEFFQWATANDYYAPIMIERCVDAMKKDPSTILVYGLTQLVNENGEPTELYRGDVSFDDENPSKRFTRICEHLILNNAQCGVYRLETLRCTRLDRLYPSGDLALMAELALYGGIRLLPEVFYFRRQSNQTFTSRLTPIELQRFYNPQAKAPMKLIRARRHLDHVVSISRAPIPLVEKLRSYRAVIRFVRWDRQRLWCEFRTLFARSIDSA
jgi:glycosyltransferase involved in cell wall biosynthesis